MLDLEREYKELLKQALQLIRQVDMYVTESDDLMHQKVDVMLAEIYVRASQYAQKHGWPGILEFQPELIEEAMQVVALFYITTGVKRK